METLILCIGLARPRARIGRRRRLVAAIWMAMAAQILRARSIFCARLCVWRRLLWFLFRVLTLENLEKIGLFVNLKEILRNLKKSVDAGRKLRHNRRRCEGNTARRGWRAARTNERR